MKFSFPQSPTEDITKKIMDQLGGRELGNMVSFQSSSNGLTVVISKLGTSKLEFSRSDSGDRTSFELVKEKIAFAHKPFKDEVTGKLASVIEKAGGSLDS